MNLLLLPLMLPLLLLLLLLLWLERRGVQGVCGILD
jgi:hypothetical protein